MAVFTPGTPAPYTLFLRPRDPHRETWYGRRAGLEGGKTHFEADRTFIIAEAEARLFELLNGCTEVHLLIGDNPALDEMVSRVIARLRKNERNGSRAPRRIVDLTQTLHELRLIKDQDALTRMRRAAEITRRGPRAGDARLSRRRPRVPAGSPHRLHLSSQQWRARLRLHHRRRSQRHDFASCSTTATRYAQAKVLLATLAASGTALPPTSRVAIQFRSRVSLRAFRRRSALFTT